MTPGGPAIEIRLEKQPQKYLASADAATRKKLEKALDGITRLEGNIVKLSGTKNMFRCKIDHYRIIFSYSGGQIIIVETIDTRTNIKYRRFK